MRPAVRILYRSHVHRRPAVRCAVHIRGPDPTSSSRGDVLSAVGRRLDGGEQFTAMLPNPELDVMAGAGFEPSVFEDFVEAVGELAAAVADQGAVAGKSVGVSEEQVARSLGGPGAG